MAEDLTVPELEQSKPINLVFSYVRRPGLMKITLLSFVFGFLTLGFYRFWAKTNVRRHIWSSIHINGEPLEYTGTGMELFKGFLVVLFAIVLPVVVLVGVLTFMQGPESPAVVMLQMLFALAAYVLWGYALYKARKYQLSRTTWRGIRGALVGSAVTYTLLYFGSMLAKGTTLGWSTPVMNTVLQEQIVNDMRFGDASFKFKGRAATLYLTYALCWFLTLIALITIVVMVATTPEVQNLFSSTLGNAATTEDSEKFIITIIAAIVGLLVFLMIGLPMLWSIYAAQELRTFASYTRFDGAPFTLRATAAGLIALTIGNILLIVITLGIGWPFTQQRTIEFVVKRLSLDGLVDIDRISQSKVPLSTRGEGLADAFDVGGI